MRKHVLVTGGQQHPDALKRPLGLRFKQARLLSVDLETGQADILASYEGECEAYPEEGANSIFLSATIAGDRLYLCTGTEVLEYSYPGIELLRKVSYPCFQDIHHVKPIAGNRLAVVSTGLDMLVYLDRDSLEPVEYINVEGKDPWHRFSKDEDYRQQVSLKPHDAHANHVFEIDDSIWVTRLIQKDAVCVDDFSRHMDIGVERPHDGFVHDGGVYFTTVDGHVVRMNATTLEREDVLDLNGLEDSRGPLGWCRGLLVEDGLAYVGFSRLRETKIKENVKWAVRYLKSSVPRETRVAVYDLEARKKLKEVVLSDTINAVYSVMADQGRHG